MCLYVRASLEEIGKRLSLTRERVAGAAGFGQEKMYAARLEAAHALRRQDGLCGLERALRLGLPGGRARCLSWKRRSHFALRSLDRILAEAWQPERACCT